MAYRYELYPGKKSFFQRLSVTNQLIAINLFFYLISLFVFKFYGEKFFLENIALNPSLIVEGKSPWTFFTSMFSHISLFHIFANMFSLFFIGNFLERIVGRRRLLIIYLTSGIIGGVFFVLSGLIFPNNAGIGASGAIFGLLGVLAVLVPYSKIYLILGPLLLILIQVILSSLIPDSFLIIFNSIINVLIVLMIFSIFSLNSNLRKFSIPVELPMWILPIISILPLMILGYFFPLPIGNSAHLGGLLGGLLYGVYLRKKFPKKTMIIERHFR